MVSLQSLFQSLEEKKGSDLHLKVGAPPMLRVAGKLVKASDAPLKSQDIHDIAKQILAPAQLERYQQEKDFDTAVSIPQHGRYRLSAFFQKGEMGLVLRRVSTEIPTLESLRLPAGLQDIAGIPSGLVIVSGPTGSGKSSTLAAMIDCINSQRPVHILTVEDPVEFLHPDKLGIVNQRDVGVDTQDFDSALRYCLRQDADVLMIGEMRDANSMMAAMRAAEVGRLVLTTLHTTDAAGIVPRILDLFAQNFQDQVRIQLSNVLAAGICQRLVPTGQPSAPLAPAVEILIGTPLVKKLIRENKLYKLYAAIETGGEFGMRTFNQSLLDMVNKKWISQETAMSQSLHPESLKLNLQGIFLDESKRILQAD